MRKIMEKKHKSKQLNKLTRLNEKNSSNDK